MQHLMYVLKQSNSDAICAAGTEPHPRGFVFFAPVSLDADRAARIYLLNLAALGGHVVVVVIVAPETRLLVSPFLC
jgi:hypothetical protein